MPSHDANETMRCLHEDLSAPQPVLDPGIVAILPVEMLQAIFRELAFEHDPLWVELQTGQYNRMRAIVPWRLVAVCRRWRHVALGMPEIWTYVAIPAVSLANPPPGSGQNLVARVRIVLERSSARPLDVLLVCDDDQSRLKDAEWLQEVLHAVAQCASRWRRVHLVLPTDVNERDLAFLRQPTPLLEEVSVAVCCDSVVSWDERDPGYLPFCPSLRTMWMAAVVTPPKSPLNLLSCAHLAIDESCSGHGLWDALCQMQMLERLSVEFWWSAPRTMRGGTPTLHLRLGRLHVLELSGFFSLVEIWTPALEMPRLRRLVICAPSMTQINRLETFIPVACAGIVDFHLGSYGDNSLEINDFSQRLVPFSAFAQLESVTFCGCLISRDALGQLNRPISRPIWPRLKSIVVDRPAPGMWFDNFILDLWQFVGIRVPTRHYNNGGHAPLAVSITGINMESFDADFDVGSRLRVLEYVLGPQDSHFTTSTGETISTVADSDRAESEYEGSLTDSDESDGGELESGSVGTGDDDSASSDSLDGGESDSERVLIVRGPSWDSDQPDDSDYVLSDECNSGHEWENDSDIGDAASP
ncbi:hypothetical protein AURDEDRAFT_160184 [Auricularia subglabra TFB-10046 SS5]|nr:hypothetical protein AURDEDRAFT_160184 [Auricularia subglabra TFB-10046 SS5]